MLAGIYRTRKIKHFLPLSFLCSSFSHGTHVPFISSSTGSKIKGSSNPKYALVPPFKLQSFKHLSSQPAHHSSHNFSREGNFDEIACQTQLICPGCGVQMQDVEPKHPGFYSKPSPKCPDYKLPVSRKFVLDEYEATDSLKRGVLNELVEPENVPLNPNVVEKPVVCARCHSLRHYGKVKDVSVENLLPDFDFDHTIGRKLASASGVRSVVLMVVDAADFDGSFPKKVAKLVSMTINDNLMGWKEGKSGNVPRLVLVLSKLDLLPTSISPTRLEHWVRQRARECGASKLTSVHMVSAVRDWGVTNLIDDVIRLVGPRGNVWAIGAQNAGKSTLINAIGKHVSRKVTLGTMAPPITEAPVPGTTLGIIRMEGILPGKAKLFDTPGLLLPHHIATRLTRDEQKLVQINKELRPRTYRIKAGQTIHVAGLLRLDIEKLSVDSIYITVWTSPFLPLHMGRTENADKIATNHFGRQLEPPIGDNRVEEIGKWVRREFHVTGNSWDASSVDVAAAGVGWFAIGIKGEATVGVWTYEGVEVILRNALLLQRAPQFEVAGFTVSKLVAESDKVSNKNKNRSRENKAACG
ncbi:hypothetical protein RND81_08G012300 [Saponaria officinalis]|uniref:G domain-containing protein n=1 Tax=Saponaria officinalis TaxID=3572 RepID=A0AAW1J1M2_SAPOF